MKIKSDFVTNSSSTSFILAAQSATAIIGNFNIDSLEKGLQTRDDRKVNFEKPYNTIIEIGVTDYNFVLSDGSEVTKIHSFIQIMDRSFDDDKKEFEILINTKFDRIYDSEEQKPHQYITELFKQIFHIIGEKEAKIVYNQYIFDFAGDGWGGDPQGKYQFLGEGILQESISGTMDVSIDKNFEDTLLITEWTKGRNCR